MGPRGRFYPYLYHCDYIGLLGIGFMQVFYLGRAPRTKEILPDFLKWCRVTRHPLVFRGLTGSQRTPQIWGVTFILGRMIRSSFYVNAFPIEPLLGVLSYSIGGKGVGSWKNLHLYHEEPVGNFVWWS